MSADYVAGFLAKSEEVLSLIESKQRHVATEDGADYYGVPIGTPLPLPRAKPITIPAERMAQVKKVDGDTVAKRLADHDAYTQSLADWSSYYGYAWPVPAEGWDWEQIIDGLTAAGPFRAVDLGNGVVVCSNEKGYGDWGAHRPADKNKFDTAVANAIILGDNAPRPGMTIQLSQWVEEANPSYEQGVLASSVSGDHHMVIYPPLLDLELGYPTPSGYAVPMSLQMMAHEWGHAVMPDMDGWNDEQRTIIDSIFSADPGNYISQYAMADPHEAFAEAFMDWFTSGGHPNTSADQAAKAFGWAEQFPLVLTMTKEAE